MKTKGFFSGIWQGQKLFGETISTLVNSLILSLVYLLGVGTSSFFGKIFGNKFLDLKPENTDSYWTELNLDKNPIEEYYHQF